MKKNKSTSHMNYASLGSSQVSGTVGQISSINEKKNNAASKQLYEVDTEKLLMSNDKVTISDLWKSNP